MVYESESARIIKIMQYFIKGHLHLHVVRRCSVSLAEGLQFLPREFPPWPTVLRTTKQKKRASRKLQLGSIAQTRREGGRKRRERTSTERRPAWTRAARQ